MYQPPNQQPWQLQRKNSGPYQPPQQQPPWQQTPPPGPPQYPQQFYNDQTQARPNYSWQPPPPPRPPKKSWYRTTLGCAAIIGILVVCICASVAAGQSARNQQVSQAGNQV